MKPSRRGRSALPVRVLLATLTALSTLGMLGGCVPGSARGQEDTGAAASAGFDGKVSIAVPGWAGGQANAAVAAYVLEHQLGVPVELVDTDPDRAWDLLDSGEVHIVLEDWGASPDKQELYIRRRQTVVPAGELGPVGHVGWFVTGDYAVAHPEVRTWEGLAGRTGDFATAATGGRGRLLLGHPDDASFDRSLIDQLGLELTVVAAGSEEELIEALRTADRTGIPVLANWWQPHWLNSEITMTEVELPPYTPGCRTDPERVRCGYPDIPLRKYLNAEFAGTGGEAVEFLRAFRWSTEDQNEVARLIADKGLTPEGAAAQWVAANPEKTGFWIGRSAEQVLERMEAEAEAEPPAAHNVG
ncbi:glycine betaine ABC transporter substrate-binding protein [Streptomyces aidingensis]|uniref:Glycine betaine/proline transport system substrate-binding protein n=1 Tax=Streptomyces aidingensis TaxID=910347 RepID=A0A1I1EFR2_9ACTN|nr:glycine betaine ABC transporter substrate-binding protein [Streptomyces aidingensis]SFB85586.1 glycine betaine/proline transport system substrate-binding protein [Streptomyces aidingensis]